MTHKKEIDLATKTVWAGEADYLVHGATQVPVVLSVAYNYDDIDEWFDVATGKKQGIFMAGIRIQPSNPLKIKSKKWRGQKR